MLNVDMLRSNDLEKEYTRIEAHARSRFEHEEFLQSAQHWKECASIAKELRKDDLRALAYRHLSFSLRGCGQNVQADEAYRRAMKYETRAADQSPSRRNLNDGNLRSPSIAASSDEQEMELNFQNSRLMNNRSTIATTSAARLFNHPSSLSSSSLAFPRIDVDTKAQDTFGSGSGLTSQEYEAGLQSLAEANALQRDRIESLERKVQKDDITLKEMEEREKRKRKDVDTLEQLLEEEKKTRETLDVEIHDLNKSSESQTDTTERERRAYEGTIETLRLSLEKEQKLNLENVDLIETNVNKIYLLSNELSITIEQKINFEEKLKE